MTPPHTCPPSLLSTSGNGGNRVWVPRATQGPNEQGTRFSSGMLNPSPHLVGLCYTRWERNSDSRGTANIHALQTHVVGLGWACGLIGEKGMARERSNPRFTPFINLIHDFGQKDSGTMGKQADSDWASVRTAGQEWATGTR